MSLLYQTSFVPTTPQEIVWSNLLTRRASTHTSSFTPFQSSSSMCSNNYDPYDKDYGSATQTCSVAVSSQPSSSQHSFFPTHGHTATFGAKESLPFSFPRPDASCFIANYAPNEPTILLPNNFLLASASLDDIVAALEDYLSRKDGSDITFTSSGSSWNGVCESACGERCTFRVCIYKSKKHPGQHIVEAQRTEGERFVFSTFYCNLKQALRS